MAYHTYYALCKPAPGTPYNTTVKVFIQADNPINARKLLEAQYGKDRLITPAILC